jgi:uncharacterized protein (DUF1499 family)
MAPPLAPSHPLRLAPRLGLLVSLVGVLLVFLPGPLNRFGLLDFRTGFSGMQWGAYAGVAGAVLCLVALVFALTATGRARGLRAGPALLGLLLGAAAFGYPSAFRAKARSVPPIHDISTDLERPPPFVAVLPLRAGAPNPAEYGGADVARQQREAYPDLKPLALPLPRAEAFTRVAEAARAEGWEVVAAVPEEGRLEATDTTPWWGFKDDVVVRVSEAGPGASVVDVRSVSRVGRSDVGKNAERIRSFLGRVRGGS